MSWLELSVECDQEAVESVSELLAQSGYNGGVVVDQPFIPGEDGPEFTYDPNRPVMVRTYLPLDAQAEDTRARIEQALWHLGRLRPIGALRARRLEEEDWANAWKQYYAVQRIGRRTVIVPSWQEYAAQPDDIVLQLDPGMAFGTGLHPTTRLCLALLEEYTQPGVTALDLGCGSGILALAAARLGATHVLALDTDPIAVTATRENAERNGLAQIITAYQGSLGAGATLGHWLGWETAPTADATPTELGDAPAFDLIAANIIARVLAMLAPDLAAALRPDGILISSGIFLDREDEVALAFAAVGLERLTRHQEGDWVALAHRKV